MKWTCRLLSAALFLAFAGTIVPHAPAQAQLFKPARFDKDPPPVDAASLKPFAARGNATIKGHLALPGTGYGQEIVLQNEPVYAVPAIPYAQWYFMSYLTKAMKLGPIDFPYDGGERRKIDEFDPTVFKYVREAKTDDQGRYEFDKLPTGKWYLIALPSVDYNGTVARSGFFGDVSVSDYTLRVVVLMGDEPGFDLVGSGPQVSHLVRIVPNERARMQCTDRRGRGVDCQKAFDLDQFWGPQSEY